jgi:hypothetical protein
MQIGIATCAALPDGWEDDRPLVAALHERGAEAEFAVWDDPAIDWERFDLVLIRSTWDYTDRRDDFVAWARRIGDALRNPPELIAWNSDKRYLGELGAAGIPVVPTRYVEPGEPPPALEGEVVVKPVVSAGARDTGRFGPGAHDAAGDLLRRLAAAGRPAMVQPYLDGVESSGETAIVCFGGAESHVLRKGAVLGPDEEAPVRDQGVTAAEAMFDEGLVGPGRADPAQRALAGEILDWLGERFGTVPTYARVDLVRGPDDAPLLLELEAVEPNFYLATAAGAAERLADVLLDGDHPLG